MRSKMLIIILCSAVFLCITGCSNIANPSNEEINNDINNNEVEKPEIIEYYKDDESINLFINKYNNEFEPDITNDMISKKRIGGRDRDDVVTISNEKLEIIIYGSNKYNELYSMSIYIGYKQNIESTNDDFKEQFIKYIKLLDDSLTEKIINTYWDNMILEEHSSYEINEIDITYNVFNGKVEYLKMSGKIKL